VAEEGQGQAAAGPGVAGWGDSIYLSDDDKLDVTPGSPGSGTLKGFGVHLQF
jgi:hypothetical protein